MYEVLSYSKSYSARTSTTATRLNSRQKAYLKKKNAAGVSAGGSAVSGASNRSGTGGRPAVDDEDAEVDMSLYLSIQAHVRPSGAR